MTSYACRNYRSLDFSRRSLLQIGGMGLLGLTMPKLLAAEERRTDEAPKVRAKSVVFLYQFGGPSQLDMFDMKPGAPEGIRSPHQPAATKVPGIQITERLPEVAKVMDKVTLIRSMHHTMKNHNSASYYALTGKAPALDDIRLRDSIDLFPAYGSVVDALAPNTNAMPTFVAYPYVCRDGSVTPGQHASFLGKAHDPLLVTDDPKADDFKLPELSLPANVSVGRLQNRRELQKLIDRQSRLLDYAAEARGLDAYYDRALSMLNTDRVRKAFDLTQESAALRDRYGERRMAKAVCWPGVWSRPA
jgi:hypothetical protein